jgi:NitT/TauT family transport system substrate-binding protein
MSSAQTRRRLLATLSSAAAASAFGGARISAQEAPPEVTTIRLTKNPGICVAPLYVAEGLLKIEGFSDVRYVEVPLDLNHRVVGTDKVDIGIGFIAQYIVELDLATPIVLLSGVHVGCFELFGTKRINSIRDLKGKTVSVPALGSAHHNFIASMAAYAGVDAKREINFVAHPISESARLLAEEKVDALMGFPPVPQELRHKKIGHVVVSSGLDRPWSQYLCRVVAGKRGVCPPVSSGREACRARHRQGNGLLLGRARAGRAPGGGERRSIRVCFADDEGDSLRTVARVRS